MLVRNWLAREWNCTVWEVDEAHEDDIGRQIEIWKLQAAYAPKPGEK